MKEAVHARRMREENWHVLEEQEVRRELASRPEGLEAAEAAERLQFYGPNALPVKPPPSLWAILLHQVRNPLIFILVAAAIASLAIGEAADAVFILIVIALNSGLGAYQEYNAERSAASLQQLLKIAARVRRGGVERELPAEEVVPGDIVLLESGRKVPADLRLLQVQNLAADESFLTGESMAAVKGTGSLPAETGIGDRRNMVFAGSTVTSGRGVGITVGTGVQTQVGIIAETVTQSESGKPPLVVRMEKFVKHVSILVLLISAGLAVLLRFQGYEVTAIFFFVVALAVSAIPEGLPVALTVVLSIATKRMSARNVIVRRLTAVESLGSCTVIASDKTGTLTVNQQTARRIVLPEGRTFTLSGEGYNGEGEVLAAGGAALTPAARDRLQKAAVIATLANEGALVREADGWTHRGDAMDVAFLAAACKLGLDPEEVKRRFPLTGEIPYESERKFSAAFYEDQGARQVAAKGAVETILDFCDRMEQEGGPTALEREGVERLAEAMAQEGLRVLAVAGGAAAPHHGPESSTLSGLVLHGLIGFLDPLRPEVAGSVKTCDRAGIKVIMITGDHPATAGAIAGELGLAGKAEPVVTGGELTAAGTPDSPAFEKRVMGTHVFARVSPSQKLEIVDVLIRRGEFVAVTGDGVNDAPALKGADIGVAMGKSGTEVTKQASDMIITDDNFASIVAAVEEGRGIYDNIRKTLQYLLAGNSAELLLMFAGVLLGLPAPLMPIHLLWINLVTDGLPALCLATDRIDSDVMARNPRPRSESITDAKFVRSMVFTGFLTAGVAFAVYYYGLQTGTTESARSAAFAVLVFAELLRSFGARSETKPIWRIPFFSNRPLIIVVAISFGLQIWSQHNETFGRFLKSSYLPLTDSLLIFGLAFIPLLALEMVKVVRQTAAAGKNRTSP